MAYTSVAYTSRGLFTPWLIKAVAYISRGLYKTRNNSYKWHRGLVATYVRPELTLRMRQVFLRSSEISRNCYDNQHKNKALVTNNPWTIYVRTLCLKDTLTAKRLWHWLWKCLVRPESLIHVYTPKQDNKLHLPHPPGFDFSHVKLKIGSCLACVYRVMDACGTFGEHERSVRVAPGDSQEKL